MRGWHKDSYRHHLAAKGISTSFFSKKQKFFAVQDFIQDPTGYSPESAAEQQSIFRAAISLPVTGGQAEKRLREGKSLAAAVAESVRREKPINMIIDDIKGGAYTDALKILKPQFDAKANDGQGESYIVTVSGKRVPVTEADQAMVKTSLSERALTLVNAKLPVPKEISDNLDKDFLDHLKTIKDAKRREDETPFRKVLREKLQEGGVAAAGASVEALPEGLGWAREGYESLGKEQQFPGVATQFGRLSESPLKKNSVLAGHEEDGLMNPLHWMDEGVPQLDQSWGFLGNVNNPALGGAAPHAVLAAKRVSEQVDSLYNHRDELSETDLKKYDEGMKAFKKGNREDLIKSISELESEENKLKDRWTLIGATHREILSMQNQQSVFHKSSDNPVLDMQSSGARKLAEQTEKLARVRADMLKAMNQTYTRRALLQNALTRMNVNIPPDKGAPKDVKRLGQSSSKFWIKDVPNPVVNALTSKDDVGLK